MWEKSQNRSSKPMPGPPLGLHRLTAVARHGDFSHLRHLILGAALPTDEEEVEVGHIFRLALPMRRTRTRDGFQEPEAGGKDPAGQEQRYQDPPDHGDGDATGTTCGGIQTSAFESHDGGFAVSEP